MQFIERIKTLFLALLLGLPCVGLGAQVEYVEANQLEKLKSKFVAAKSLSSQSLQELDQSKWTCNMYGVSSRMQVERDLKLYHFELERVDKALQLKNRGAQLVKNYQREGSEVSGEKGSIKDRVRLTGEGELISQLEVHSKKSTDQAENQRILAISRCTRLKI